MFFSLNNASFPETGLQFSLKSTKSLRNDTPDHRCSASDLQNVDDDEGAHFV